MTVAELVNKLLKYPPDAKLESMISPWGKDEKVLIFVEDNELDPLLQIVNCKLTEIVKK